MKKIVLFIVLILAGNCIAQVPENYGPTNNANPNNYIEFNNKMLYFVKNFGGFGNTLLYATDGSAANNQLIKDLGYSSDGALNDENEFKEHKIIFNNKLFFVFNKRLYSTDGTTAGTSQFIGTLNSVKYFKIFNGKLYFTALTATNGTELWSTDGTVAGTQMVKDIYPGTNGAFYSLFYKPHFTEFNNKLFFVANDGVHGYELWSTDGTDAGTSLFKDIRTIEGNGNGFGAFMTSYYNPYPFKVVGSKMYFGANPYHAAGGPDNDFIDTQNFILYETDGTASGTKYVQPPLASSNNYNYINNLSGLTVYNNKLFVYGKIAYDDVIGLSPGGILVLDTTNPIRLLKEIYYYGGDVGTTDEVERYSMRIFNDDFYFLGQTEAAADRINLWKMNPNNYTFTQMTQTPSNNLSEFSTEAGDLQLLVAKELNNRLYFVKTRPYQGQLFSTDGTTTAPKFEARYSSNAKTSDSQSIQAMTDIPSTLYNYNNALYFESTGKSLWRLNFASLSNEDFVSSTFKVYPNPATSQINVSFDNTLEKANLKVISITGQVVAEKLEVTGNSITLDVSGLQNGIYITEVLLDSKVMRTKFIKN